MLSDHMERITRAMMLLLVRLVCIVVGAALGLWVLVIGLRMVGADI